jgi:photosystem II stability/assembly factor-like uncharacterized protein
MLGPLPAIAHAQEKLEKPDLQKAILAQARWRSIGPATMGGRIADIAVEAKNPYAYYVALATGGLIKTVNDGNTWTPVFDHQSVASVGAVAVAPSDPKIVWVGTGEANGRNSSSWGDGVYKSADGGQTWQHMGLKETAEIGRIVIDPANPNIVYVAAAGRLWGANKERGVFKTTDGGKTWQHSLAIDADTGAIDVALSGTMVYAAMYQRRRTPWGFTGIGSGAGLYRSADAGKTWQKLANGLPAGPLGRIGIGVSKSKPDTVYAVIESPQGGARGLFDQTSKYGGIFRSTDAGQTWQRMSGAVPRGFYFGQIRVDPANADRIYVLGFDAAVSEDGGKTFKNASPGVHSDLHALWIDPERPDRLLLGTDGGLYASHDRAKTWDMIANFPMGEFYEVKTDNRTPFWVYGGLQDNGCWAGPSALHAGSGPANADWIFLEGGDGFYVIPDLVHPDIVYAESQGGGIVRIDRRTGLRKYLHPAEPEGEQSYRFNWNTPMTLSSFDADILYVGGNHLFKWTRQGAEVEAISPDLSKQNGERIAAAGSGAETYGAIVTLAESPLKRGQIWVGTDDGNVQLTRDDGKTWTDLTRNLPGHVRDYYVKRIEASRYEAGRAYVAIDGHRSDDIAPYLFTTDDYGASWRSITGDLPHSGPVKTIREDPANPNLLFAGTEFGAWVSFDRGGRWHTLGAGLPTVAVDDLTIQPRDHALVAATHGRSIWVLDNLLPLEEWTPKMQETQVHLFPVPPAVEFIPEGRDWFGGAHSFKGENPPTGAVIAYWLRSLVDSPPSIAITDAAGKEVATLGGERLPGLHIVTWDMRRKPEEGAFPTPQPQFVKPGIYTVTLTLGKEKQTQKITVSGQAELSEIPADAISTEQEPRDKDEIGSGGNQ